MAAAVKCDECGAFAPAHEVSPRFVGMHRALPEGWVLLNVWKGSAAGLVPTGTESSDIFGEFCGLTCASKYVVGSKAVTA